MLEILTTMLKKYLLPKNSLVRKTSQVTILIILIKSMLKTTIHK
jgi:hypothetical protein